MGFVPLFSKTYANIKNAYYFNGRWETFGGVDWKVNKYLQLGCTVINFLNQTGAKGSIAGAELVDKEDAAAYNGAWMSGSYIRPFTVEFSAKSHSKILTATLNFTNIQKQPLS